MSALTVLLEKAAQAGIDDIKAQMSELGMDTSGKTASSLRSSISGATKIEIIAEQSILTLIFGRAPGKMPPVDDPDSSIREWVIAKGLPEGSEWGVAINIGKFGSQIFQGKRKGIDIARTTKVMIDFFIPKIIEVTKEETSKLIVDLYR